MKPSRLGTNRACQASVPGRNDAGAFDHENDSAFARPRPMDNALRDHESLPWREFDCSSSLLIKVDDETTLDDVEELVLRLVEVPMVISE